MAQVTSVAWVQSLAQGLPHALCAAQKNTKQNNNKKIINPILCVGGLLHTVTIGFSAIYLLVYFSERV